MKENIQSRIEKTLAGQTVIKTNDGVMVRRKRGPSGEKIKTARQYKRTRENMANFGLAATLGKTFRGPLAEALALLNDNTVYTRISRVFHNVLKADIVNKKGEQDVRNGDLSFFQDFQFNKKSPLGSSLMAPFTASIDRVSGLAQVTIPSFMAEKLVFGPQGATHFVIQAVATSIDFHNESYESGTAETENILLDAAPTGDITLQVQLPANSEHPQFLVLGIQFTQVIHGVTYALSNDGYNALAVVFVSTV
jgi:hypothetical protein